MAFESEVDKGPASENKLSRSNSSGKISSKIIPVRVAVRVRPLVPREQQEGCQSCLEVIGKHNQVRKLQQSLFLFST